MNPQSDSESTVSQNGRQAQRRRRSSFFIFWDNSLEIPSGLKKLRKHRLELSQQDFALLEYQLYCTGCVTSSSNMQYTHPAVTVNLPNRVYIRLQRYLPFYKLLKLCMWRYLNLTETVPSDMLSQIFQQDMADMDEEDEDGVIQTKNITLNDKHTIQNCVWTVKQRKAVANTRDHFFNDFQPEEPMLFDLPFGPSNKKVIRDFLVGMWKAEIDEETVFYICAELLGLQEVYPRPVPERLRQRAAVQRSSITDMTPESRQVVAAILIQDFYRQRLERKRNAVKLIEIAWEPYRLQGVQIRRDTQEYLHELTVQAENSKDFNWDKYCEEIKEDYSAIAQPSEAREIAKGDRYWLKVIALLFLPMCIATTVYLLTDLRVVGGIDLIVFIIYVMFALLMLFQMGDPFWLYLQTICNLAMLAFLVNTTSHSSIFKFARLYMLTFLVILGGKKWTIAGMVYLIISNAYSVYQQAELLHYIVSNIFDIYGIITIATASRRGLPIEMLHKLSVNLIVGVFVLGGIAFSVFIGCVKIDEGELPV